MKKELRKKTLLAYVSYSINGKKYIHSLSPLQLTKFISVKANSVIKRANKMLFRVNYGKGFTNEKKDCKTVDDLKWCQQAFVKEYL